jgi:8-oxo-dGTP pyrophosphatase MutT (NUDIX family)
MNRWEAFDPPAMAQQLAVSFARGLPGRTAQRTMAHSLAYGRHHGPVPSDARRAAVLLALHKGESGWSIPAILRPTTMRAHADQVSLPGGMIEAGETAAQTAVREFEEELGALTSGVTVVGRLTPVYVFVSGVEVTPVVAICAEPLAFQPNPHEVAELLALPLTAVADDGCRGRHWIERRGLRFSVPHFAVVGKQIWGATSLILAEFVALLKRR